MKISAQEEFGLRCLLQLARRPETCLSLRQIAESEGISVAYAGKLLWILNRAGLVRSTRGAKGGYALARPAREIMVSEIIKILDEDEVESHCQHYAGERDVCIHNGDCSITPLVEGLNLLVQNALSQISLAQIMGGEVAALTRLTRIGHAKPTVPQTEARIGTS
jgi:Rrf2 family iron-sulfur cluster assembly transcriptional regulator